MQYEIDYIPVGTGSKGGDAIVFRYGDFSDRSKCKVVVIDGGTKDSGKALVEHIKTHYGTTHVDLVVASHLHCDHISGLTEVIENLTVGRLAVHCPWDYTSEIKRMTHTPHTLTTIEKKLEKSLTTLSSLIELAESKKIPIIQPFQRDVLFDGLHVLGPSKEYYTKQLANFGCTPEVKDQHKIETFFSNVKEAVTNWVDETFEIETLTDEHEDTDPENNSSLVLLLVIGDEKFMFTGDAGKGALYEVIQYTDSIPYSLSGLDFFGVPHHGSKRNLGPTILNKLSPKHAYISCPPEGDPKHPSRKVMNALNRRNSKVATNKTQTICYRSPNAPQRQGWGPITYEPFYNEVEE